MDEFNYFRAYFVKVKADPSKWEMLQGVLAQLPQKQRRFLSERALTIQKVVVDGEVTLRQIIKIKRPVIG